MKVTPREIRQQHFPLRLRGCDPTEVEVFLDLVATTLDELLMENARLREALGKKDQEIQDIRVQEKDWKKALLAVQQARDDLIARGQQEAQLLVAEAQRQVHQFLSETEKTRYAIAQDVQLLMYQKRQLIGGLHNLLSQHLALLQVQEGQDERRQSSDMSGSAASPFATPQTADDAGHMGGAGESAPHVMQPSSSTPAPYSLLVGPDASGTWLIYEEHSVTRP
jgi:cell division initiation protein